MSWRRGVHFLKQLGGSIAIDDFGTDFASLTYVHRLNPEVIKIDRSFVMRWEQDPLARAIVTTITRLARGIGASTVAEGVENHGQAAMLVALGCTELQGYLIGRPLEEPDALALASSAQISQLARVKAMAG